jgi:putative ABC transport system permease protein
MFRNYLSAGLNDLARNWLYAGVTILGLAAFWAMDHWLHGFAYRVDLPAWLFLLAAAVAVLIAWATVSVHAWLAARARPATALRYE